MSDPSLPAETASCSSANVKSSQSMSATKSTGSAHGFSSGELKSLDHVSMCPRLASSPLGDSAQSDQPHSTFQPFSSFLEPIMPSILFPFLDFLFLIVKRLPSRATGEPSFSSPV